MKNVISEKNRVQIRMNNTNHQGFRKSLLAMAMTTATTLAQAGSFGLIEHSASGQGAAFAGASALGEDASTVYFNPAAMTRLSGSEVVLVGHVIIPDAKFTNTGSTDAVGTSLPGFDTATSESAFVPNFYWVTELDSGVRFGLGVNVPFGLSTNYNQGWVGRYHALKSEIKSINVNPSIAWKASDRVSVGFGVSIQYIELTLSSTIDSYGACTQFATTGTDCLNAGLTGLGVASQDSYLTLQGDSIEAGWNLGFLIDLDKASRLGISYRSAIKHNVSGSADYTLDARLQPFADGATAATGFNILQDTSLKAIADLPDTLSISYVRELNEKMTILADWTWTGWNSLGEIVINQQGNVPGREAKLELNYANTNRYSLGINYQYSDALLLRTGIALDETPIRTPEQTSARIPGNDRKWLSVGFGYAPADNWSVDVGYTHIFLSDTDINNNAGASSSNATLKGTYESTVDIISAQLNLHF